MEVLYQLSYAGGEREKRLEPSTLSLEGWCSTNWATPALMWAGMDLNHRRLSPADLQSAAIDHSATDPKKYSHEEMSHWRDSNPRPADYKSAALANWATMASEFQIPQKYKNDLR